MSQSAYLPHSLRTNHLAGRLLSVPIVPHSSPCGMGNPECLPAHGIQLVIFTQQLKGPATQHDKTMGGQTIQSKCDIHFIEGGTTMPGVLIVSLPNNSILKFEGT